MLALPEQWEGRAVRQVHPRWLPLTSPWRQLACPGRPLAKTLPLQKTPCPKSAKQVRRTPAPRNKLSAGTRACVSLARRLRASIPHLLERVIVPAPPPRTTGSPRHFQTPKPKGCLRLIPPAQPCPYREPIR